MTGRKCVVCGRRIPRSNPYLKDEDTGRSYHKKCFQKEFGSLRGVGVVENPVKAGGDADTVSQILIAVGKFATSDEGKKVLSYATDKPLEALMEAAEQKELIPAGSAKKQAGAVRKLFGSVLTQEAAGIRTNIAPVVVGALQLAGALYTTKAGRTLIKASSPPFWAVKGVEVGSGIVGGALAKKGGAAGKVGKGLQTVSHGVKKAEEWEDKGMETVGKALTLQFNPARTVAKAGYRRVGKTPDNTTFYLRVVLDDGTDIPSLALFKHRVVVGTEAEIDDGYKAYVGKPIRALIDYIRTKPGEYILAEEFAAKLSNPENARERVHSLKLMEPVTRLISAWDKKDRVRMLEAEEEIYKITGMRKVIPFALTAEERHDPWLLARRISCVAQMKGRGDIYNPFALCRSAVRANPVDPRYKDIVAELIKKGYAVDTSDETQPDIYGVWTDLRFVDDPAYLRFLSDAEAQTLYEEVKKKHPAFVMPFRTWDREARAVVTAPRVVIGERDAEQNIEELKRLYVAGFDFTRYFHGTVGNLEIPGYWELEGHTGKYRQLDADSAAKVVAELTRAGFKTKVEKWTAVDVFDGGRYDAASVEILDTASMPFTLIENPMQCNPSSEDWTEAIAGEGWAIGDYTAMLEGATPEEAAVLEHIIVEEKEHLAELMALRGCKSNPAKLRPLTGEEIEKLASRKGVRRIAVENFLSTMGDNYEDATGNFYQDANSYGWNSATRKAISDGIYKAVANENPGVRENIKMNKSDYVFQLRAYHGYKAEDLEGKTLAEVKELFNRCYRARSNPGYGGRGHKLLTDELKRQLPPLYSQESVKDPTVWVKFFSPYSGWQWYITEGSEQDGDYLMFGFIHGFEDELGYVSFNELDTAYRGTLPLVERDLYWKPRPLSDVKKELGASNPLYMGDHYVLSCSCMPSRGQHWQRTADTVEEAEKIAAEHFASCSRAQDEGGVQVVRAGEWVPQANPRGLTSRVFGNLVAVYHVPGFLGPMVGLHMPPMEGFIGGWKKGNADYVLKRGPRGGWRWEHKSGDGRYIPLALDNGVDYSWQTDNRVLEAIHKYREEWNQRWGARHSVENPKMKMTDEDFAELDGAIQKLFQAYPDWMSRFPGLPERRMWAALYKAVEDSYYPRESMTRLYSYLNDAHIYTALQRIFDKWFLGGRANPITPMCQMAFDQLPQWVQKKLRTLEVSMPDALFKPCDVRVTWDNTDTEGRIHFLKSVGLIIKGRKNPSFECQECGRKFHRSKVGFEVKCPKCGSYDVDIGYASNPKAKIVKKVASFDLDDYQLAERLKAMYPGEDRQAMYSRFVQERNLSPGIDARTFYAIYDSVTPDLHIIESDVEFTPTHINKITGFKTMFWDDAAGVHRFVDETGSTGSYPPRFDILESFDAINADPVERCVCIKEPRGDHGLEGYQLNETYYCQHVMKPGKKPYYRVWPEPFSRSDYETVGPNSFRKYFAPSVNGTVRSNPETSEAVRALPPLPRKTFALFPSERGKMCTHPLAHWNGKMPCTGEYVCSMCGSVLDPKTHKVIRVGTGSVEARKRENIGFRTVRGVRVGACPACGHKMKIDEAVLAMTPITTCSQCGEDVYFGYDDDETPRSNPLERPNANDGIRDMFYSMSFRGVVPDKDIQHILKSKRWERAYGKGAIADAWTVLVEGGLVERKGDNWHWVGYMSNPAENPAPNWEPGTALTYQGKKFWQPATFIRMVGADHAEVDLNEGRRIVHLSLLSVRGSRNPVNEMQYCPRCEWTGTPQTDTDIHMPFECPRCGCMFHKQSTDIYLKSFDDPDTAREWAERNKVEVIDVSYIHDAAQYVLSYRGFPVEQERYDEPAENPRALLPVTVAMKDAMGY